MNPGDRGSILPLLLGCCAVAVGLVLLCAAATGIGTTRMTLYAVADAAAGSAAQSFALDAVSESPVDDLDPDRARAVAEEVAADTPSTLDIRITDVTVDESGTVTLSAAADWSTGLVVLGVALDAPVAVTVDARAIVR